MGAAASGAACAAADADQAEDDMDMWRSGRQHSASASQPAPLHRMHRSSATSCSRVFFQVYGHSLRRTRRRAKRALHRTFTLLFLASAFQGAVGKKEYAIYIDAGSSGSRAFVYRWEARTYDIAQLPPKMVRPERVVGVGDQGSAVTPGISYYAGSDELLDLLGPGTQNDNGLDRLIDFCRKKLKEEGIVDEKQLAKIPLYVGATAGIRKMDAKARTKVMRYVREYFAGPNSQSPFLRNEEFIRVISGEEEGVYGWLATNYLMGTLGTASTYGLLDVGGASTQVTYQISSKDYLTYTYQVQLSNTVATADSMTTLPGDNDRPGTVRLFSHSFLYFGQDEAYLRIDANVLGFGGAETKILAKTANSEIPHPCLPAGFKRKWKASAQRFLPKDYGTVASEVSFKGISDFEACYRLAKPTMLLPTLDDPCWEGEWPNKECRLQNRYFPPLPRDRRFIAVSSVSYFQQFLSPIMKRKDIPSPWPLNKWREGIQEICQMSYTAVKSYNQNYNIGMPAQYLGNYCMLGVYLHVLFTIGFGMADTFDKVYPVSHIKGYEFDIGFGYMLEHANDLPWKIDVEKQWEHTTTEFALMAWSALALGCLGSVCGGVVLICCRLRIEACLDWRDNHKQRLLYRATNGAESLQGVEMTRQSRWVRGSSPATPEAAAASVGDWPRENR